MHNKPAASSTPKCDIKGRESIRKVRSPISPIETSPKKTELYLRQRRNRETGSASESGDSNKDTEEEVSSEVLPIKYSTKDVHSNELEKTDLTMFCIVISILFCIVIFFLLLIALGYNSNSEEPTKAIQITIEELKEKFPPQNEDFWLNIQVAVDNIIALKQPKSMIFLHTSETNIDIIFQGILEYSSIKLFSKLTKPIIIKSEDLNRPDIKEDYGVFLSEMKEKLKEDGIVIIKNLDKVPSSSAQAFHSLCEEETPMKENILYLFTIQANNLPKNIRKFVEEVLRKSWSNLHDDKFYPLFARISSYVLQIH